MNSTKVIQGNRCLGGSYPGRVCKRLSCVPLVSRVRIANLNPKSARNQNFHPNNERNRDTTEQSQIKGSIIKITIYVLS
jgi:hypothetical protein